MLSDELSRTLEQLKDIPQFRHFVHTLIRDRDRRMQQLLYTPDSPVINVDMLRGEVRTYDSILRIIDPKLGIGNFK